MNRHGWKIFGSLCSVLWMMAVGWITWVLILFAIYTTANSTAPNPEHFKPMGCLLVYILFGLGPVSGFVLLMKAFRMPLELAYLIGLAICASIPMVANILFLLSWKY